VQSYFRHSHPRWRWRSQVSSAVNTRVVALEKFSKKAEHAGWFGEQPTAIRTKEKTMTRPNRNDEKMDLTKKNCRAC
jgi:hypothetical protein